jgi:hypothetical protein
MADRKRTPSKRKAKRTAPHPAAPAAPRRPKGQRPEDGSEFGVVDSGLSVDPEELGRQFLSDAAEQDNFESLRPPPAVDAVPEGDPLVSEATLKSSDQRTELPESAALAGAQEVPAEPKTEEVDLLTSNELPSSLFDHPARSDDDELEEGEDQERAEAEQGRTHAPAVNADEEAIFERHAAPAEVDPEARARAMQEERAALRRTRDRSEPKADRGAWESNRRGGRRRSFHRGQGR